MANKRTNEWVTPGVRMGPRAAVVLAESLEKNETLLRLHLRDNPMGEKGGRRLIDALNKNEKLQLISLQGAQLNSAQDDVAEALRQREVDRAVAAAAKGGGKKGKVGWWCKL